MSTVAPAATVTFGAAASVDAPWTVAEVSVTVPPLVISSAAVTGIWLTALPASSSGDPTQATPSLRTPERRGSM